MATVKTAIIDKNGKATHVHKSKDVTPAAGERVAKVRPRRTLPGDDFFSHDFAELVVATDNVITSGSTILSNKSGSDDADDVALFEENLAEFKAHLTGITEGMDSFEAEVDMTAGDKLWLDEYRVDVARQTEKVLTVYRKLDGVAADALVSLSDR